jgi:hypothetical protein
VTLKAETDRIVLPSVQEEDLLAAAGEPASWGQRSGITVAVAPPEPGHGWELKLRASPSAGRVGVDRSPRVYWKLDSEPPSAFRSLYEDEQVVLRSEKARGRKVTIDLAFGVDWEVAPGRYDVDFVFSVEPL